MTRKIRITGTNERGETITEEIQVDEYKTFFSQHTFATIGDDRLWMRLSIKRRHWLFRLWQKLFRRASRN